MNSHTLKNKLTPLYHQLQTHAMYAKIHSIPDLQRFMEHHIVAVWDFMFLLKALQKECTCIALPWRPTGDAQIRRLINEIVLAEESDLIDGVATSHFELYLRAMTDIGADTAPMIQTLRALDTGLSFTEAISQSTFPDSAKTFIMTTWDILESRSLPAIAAAFALGREDVIPDMFVHLVQHHYATDPNRVATYKTYLERHIELDGDDHGPMAMRLLDIICGTDTAAWQAAEEAAKRALSARIALWDSIQSNA
jgi:hypothetical protein